MARHLFYPIFKGHNGQAMEHNDQTISFFNISEKLSKTQQQLIMLIDIDKLMARA